MKLLAEIVCTDDVLRLGLPIGEYGRIVQIEDNPKVAVTYLVRFPQVDHVAWCTPKDLMDYSYFLKIKAMKEIMVSYIDVLTENGMSDEADAVADMIEEENYHYANEGWGTIEVIEDEAHDILEVVPDEEDEELEEE